MEQFMMPPGAANPLEIPPGMPQAAGQVPVAQEVQLAPEAQAQTAKMAVLQQEGAQGGSQAGDGFFDKLRTDPKIAQSMMIMGLRMMQGPKHGQDSMGVLGDAMMAGATAHNMLKYNEGESARKDAEFGLKKEESGVRMEGVKANTAQTMQETGQKAETFPEVKAKLAQEVKNLRTSGRSAEADALVKEARAGNIKTELDLDNLVRRNQAASAGANAASSSSLAADRNQELSWKRTLADPKATAEAKASAQAALAGGRGTGGAGGMAAAGVQNRADLLKYYQGINPEASGAELNQMVLDHERTAKVKEGGQAFVDFVSKTGMPIGTEAEMLAAEKAFARIYGAGGKTSKAPAAAAGTDMSKWEKQGGYALKPGADRTLKSSWVQVQ